MHLFRSVMFVVLVSTVGCHTSVNEDQPMNLKSINNENEQTSLTRRSYLTAFELKLNFEKFTTENGLIGNAIQDIDQDKAGNLWISTESGICLYDGIEFTPLPERENNPKSIGNVPVLELDNDGNAWFIESGIGLVHYNVKNMKYTIHTDTLMGIGNNNEAKKLYLLNDFIYFTQPFGCFDIKKSVFRLIDKKGNLSCISPDSSKIYVFYEKSDPSGSNRNTLDMCVYTLTEERRISGMVARNIDKILPGINDVVCGNDDMLYFGTQMSSMMIYNQSSDSLELILPNPNKDRRFDLGGSIKHMYFDPVESCLWITGYCHLLKFNCNSGPKNKYRFIRYSPDQRDNWSLSDAYCTKIFRDNENNLWVGSNSSGIMVNNFRHKQFKIFRSLYGDTTTVPSDNITACAFDKDGRLCAGTKGHGLALMVDDTLKKFRQYKTYNPYPSIKGNINSISGINYSNLSKKFYISSWGNYIFELDQQKKTCRPLLIKNHNVEDMVKAGSGFFITMQMADNDGFVFFADWDGWLDVYNIHTQKFYYFKHIDSIKVKNFPTGTLTRSIYVSSNHYLYISNDAEANLQRIGMDGMKTFEGCLKDDKVFMCTAQKPEILPLSGNKKIRVHGSINVMREENYDVLWIGTNHGLYRYIISRDSTEKFGAEDGFNSESINSMEWHKNDLWIGTQNGLYCFDTKQKKILSSWNRLDGLPDNYFNVNASAVYKDSLLAFGTLKGMVVFEPLKMKKYPDKAYLKSMEINGIKGKPNHILNHYEKNITFYFGVSDLANVTKTKYEYTLKGLDKNWKVADYRPDAKYTNLSPGNYTFLIREKLHGQETSQTAFDFKIMSPWYQTWWFILLTTTSLIWALGYYLNKIKKIQAEKEKEHQKLIKYLQVQTLQAQINPHFIFNVLGTMQNQILNKDPQEANKHLLDLSKLIRRFLDSSVQSNTVGTTFSKNEISLFEEMELLDMYVKFEQIQREGKFDYSISVAPDLDTLNTYLPPLIIQPYVENAIKHGILYSDRKCNLVISFTLNGDQLLCIVKDNGVGRLMAEQMQKESKRIYVSRGKKLVEERVEILNEIGYDIDINTEDNPKGGTIVTIKIK